MAFLIGGPGVSASTLLAVWRLMGWRTTLIYVTVLAACAIGFGLSHKSWLEQQVLADQQAARERGEAFDDEAAREKYFPDLEDLNFDDGGRFFMPEDIKGMMGIGETALFVGTGRHIQIWAPEKYLEYKGRSRRVVYAVEQYLAAPAKGAGK